MENLGQKITELRKKNNLTQSELGEKLNVTSQAVSKWENNLSEPDLETTKRLCEIFDVSMNELLNLSPSPTQASAEPAPVIIEKIIEKPVETPQATIILGYCKACNKPISDNNYKVDDDGVGIICNECSKIRRINRANNNYNENVSEFRRGLIWGGISFMLSLTVGLILGFIMMTDFWIYFGIGAGFGYMVSALVAECLWDGSALDVLGFFCRSFQMPGIIFTWDWDGIKFLIIMKITFAILSAVLSVGVFLIGLVVSLTYASILFPFSLIATINNLNNSRNEISVAQNS